MTLAELNALDERALRDLLLSCCHAPRWAEAMLSQRPFADHQQLFTAAETTWHALDPTAWREAFAAHPRIGDLSQLRQRFGHEQSGVCGVDDPTLQALADGNRTYEARHGFLFLVCATGKSAAEMLAILQQRLGNDTTSELRTAATEQAKITRLRLERILS